MALAALLNRPAPHGAELIRDEASGEWHVTGRGKFSPQGLRDILAAAEAGPVRIAGLSFRQRRQLKAFRLAHLIAQ